MKILIFILAVITSFLMFIALGDNNYGFYTFLRFSTFISCGIITYLLYKDNADNPYIFVFGGIALLFNPFIPVHLSRELWGIINLVTALGLPVFAIQALRSK